MDHVTVALPFALFLNIVLLVMFIATVVNVSIMRKMLEGALFPEGRPSILRVCPHCHRQIPGPATVCSFCTRESEPWEVHDGRWWTTNEAGRRVYLDPMARAWIDPADAGGE